MHAIWFSIFVPALAAVVWIWPRLRSPNVWLILALLFLLATGLWVGNDLIHFVQVKGSMENIGLRTLYLFLSEPDKPVLQLTCGFFMAGLFSLALNRPTNEPKIGEEATVNLGEG